MGSAQSTDAQGCVAGQSSRWQSFLFENQTKFCSYLLYFLIGFGEIRCEKCAVYWRVSWKLGCSHFQMAVNYITFMHVQWHLLVRKFRFCHCLWDLRSSEQLRSLDWCLFTDI